MHNLLFLVNYNLVIKLNKNNIDKIGFFKKIGFSFKKNKSNTELTINLNKIETRITPYLFKYKNVYLNTYNNSIIELDPKKNEIISNKKKLMLVGFLVPILTDFRSIFKSIIKNSNKPNGINIITTYACNLNCPYCFEGKNKNSEIIINLKQLNNIWKTIIPNIKNNFSMSFFGGEPMLNNKAIFYFTDKLRKYAKKNNMKYFLKMITNGTMIDDNFIHFFKKNEFSHIQLTFDGKKETHNRIRGYYDTIMNSIIKLEPITKTIGIRYNLTKYNNKEIPVFIKDILKKIPKSIQKKIFISLGFVDSVNNQISEKELNKTINNTFRLINNTNLSFISRPTQKIINCPAQLKNDAWIDLYSNKYFCERVIGKQKYKITSKSNFKNYYPFQCFSCNLYPICGGLCWAQSEFKLDYYFNCLNSKFIVKQEIKKYLSKGAKK